MPFKSLSVMEVPREEFQTSARSAGSDDTGDAKATEGSFVPTSTSVS